MINQLVDRAMASMKATIYLMKQKTTSTWLKFESSQRTVLEKPLKSLQVTKIPWIVSKEVDLVVNFTYC
jgi:hypothetical protein